MSKKEPDKIVFKFKAIARISKNRQSYFTIPKRYVDDGYIETDKEYTIYLEEVKKEE